MQVTASTFENNPSMRNHIIVCGIHSSIKNFIIPLRAKYLKEFQIQKIVIITGESEENSGDQIDPKIWASISRFKHIYLVFGSPLKQQTLLKANLNYADKVVILGNERTIDLDDVVEGTSEEILDDEVIYIYKAVKQCNKDV